MSGGRSERAGMRHWRLAKGPSLREVGMHVHLAPSLSAYARTDEFREAVIYMYQKYRLGVAKLPATR